MDQMDGQTSTIKVMIAVGRVTFREIVSDKVLYNIILCAFLLFGVGYLASRIMFVRQDRVVLDFGLSAVNISCAMIGGFTGAGLIGRELERRTMLVALSRPISRLQFILGKFAGLTTVLFINWLLLSGVFFWILWGSSASLESIVSPTLFCALILLFFQSMLLAGAAIFFSSFSTTSLAVIFTVGIYLLGNNITQIRLVAGRTHSLLGKGALNTTAILLPNLEYFNLASKVTYGIPVGAQFMLVSILYAFVIATVALMLSSVAIRTRES